MVRLLQPTRSEGFTDQQQAAFFHSRERRKSLAGVLKLYRTARFFGPTMATTLPVGSLNSFNSPVTFQTAVRVTGPAPTGTIFEYGGLSLAVATSTITLTASGQTATFDNVAPIPDGIEIDLSFSIKPGDGKFRIWGNGNEIARLEVPPFANWATDAGGTFAQSPSDYEVVEPLSVYLKQFPRHFV